MSLMLSSCWLPIIVGVTLDTSRGPTEIQWGSRKYPWRPDSFTYYSIDKKSLWFDGWHIAACKKQYLGPDWQLLPSICLMKPSTD